MATLDTIPQRQLDVGAASWFRAEANSPVNNQVKVKAGWAHIAAQSVVDRFTAGDQQTPAFAVVAVGFERWDLISLDSTGAPVITQGTAFASPAPLYKGAPGNSFGPDAPDQFPIAYVHITEPVTVIVDAADVTSVSGLVELRRVLEGHRVDKGATGVPAGSAIVVTALFVGETSGGSATARGVVTVLPNNLVRFLDQNFGRITHAAANAEVFGRLTFSVGVWTLTFRYVDVAGVEQTVANIVTDTLSPITSLRLVAVPKVFSTDETTRPVFDNTTPQPTSALLATSITPFGGDGSLGTVTIAAGLGLSGVKNYLALTINPAVVVTVPVHRALHIKCRSNLTNNGTITAAGAGFVAGVGGVLPVGFQLNGVAGTAAEGFGFSPGGGGASGVFRNPAPGGVTTQGAGGQGGPNGANAPGYDGRSGGAGGAAPGASLPGAAGAASPATHAWLYDIDPPVGSFAKANAPGGGGGGGGSGSGDKPANPVANGGDGGNGGGIVVLEVLGNVTEGTVSCDGVVGVAGQPEFFGFGFDVGAGGGGGGGGGGRYLLLYTGTLTAGTATANGGAGGAGGAGANPGAAGGLGPVGVVTRVKVSP